MTCPQPAAPLPPISRMLVAATCALGLLAGCDTEPPTDATADLAVAPASPERAVPTFTERSDTAWRGEAPAGAADPVVATVSGVPIRASEVRLHLDADPTLTPREAIARLVELEAAAQAALDEGLHRVRPVAEAYRTALSRAWLVERFEPSVTPEQISAQEVARIFQMPRIRKLYDHEHAWHMAHLMLTCCDPKIEDCGLPDVVECFAAAGEAIQRIHAEVKPLAEPVEGDPAAVDQVLREYRQDAEGRYGELAYRDRSFYYDPETPHEEQKGYNLIAEVVARAVIDTPLGTLSEPIQSPFGWHIVVKLDHDPETRLGPEDPTVLADIRNNAFPGFKQARFQRSLSELNQRYGVMAWPDRLEALEGR